MPPDPPTTLPDAEARQREALYRLVRESYWNLAVASSLVVGLLGLAAFLLFSAGHWMETKEEEILQGFQEELASHSDVLAVRAADLASEAVPPVAEALREEARKDLPEYVRALDRQGAELASRLEASLQKKVEAHYGNSLTRYRDVLQEEFPGVRDPETQKRLLAALETAFQRQARLYYVQEFRGQTQRLEELWKHVPPLQREEYRGRELQELLVESLMDWLRVKVRENVVPPTTASGPEPAGTALRKPLALTAEEE